MSTTSTAGTPLEYTLEVSEISGTPSSLMLQFTEQHGEYLPSLSCRVGKEEFNIKYTSKKEIIAIFKNSGITVKELS